MAVSQLSLYNAALLELGERKLSSLTEEREFRRTLDQVWDSGDIRVRWLEQGLWNFAMRSVELNFNSALSPPDFGYAYTFDKPTDWIRTARVAQDQYFVTPLNRYDDESNYFYADLSVIYVSYVSDDATFGLDYSLWPGYFTRFCELDLAKRIMHRATGLDPARKEEIIKEWRFARTEARSRDAMNEPSKQLPQGSWLRARYASRVDSGTYD